MDPRTTAATKVQAPGPTSRKGSYGMAAAARWAAAVASTMAAPRSPPVATAARSTCNAASTAAWDTRWGSWLTETPSHTTRAKPPGFPSTQRTPTASSLRQCVEPRSVTAATGPSTTSRWSRVGVRGGAQRSHQPSVPPFCSPQPGQRDRPGTGAVAQRSTRPSGPPGWAAVPHPPGTEDQASPGPAAVGGRPVRAAPHTSHHRSAQTTGSPQAGQPMGTSASSPLLTTASAVAPGWPGRPCRCVRGASSRCGRCRDRPTPVPHAGRSR